MRRFDDRSMACRAQYRMAFLALNPATSPRMNFVDGINKWLIPSARPVRRIGFQLPDEGALTA